MNIDTLNQSIIGIMMSPIGIIISWGGPQLILAVLAAFAARRHKLAGFWVLSAAAILSMIQKIALALIATLITDRGESGRIFASLNFYPSFLISLVSFVGWLMLAFHGRKKSGTTPNLPEPVATAS